MNRPRYVRCNRCRRFMERGKREPQICDDCRRILFGFERGLPAIINRNKGAVADAQYHGDQFETGEW